MENVSNTDNTPIIEVIDARKIYKVGNEKVLALDGVSFTINKGDFCCLLGSSGSGKSTLLNIMAGIEKITSGQVFIKGQEVTKMGENKLAKFRQKYLGFVFQAYNLVNSLTAQENVEMPMIFKEIPSKKRAAKAREMLIKVGLKERIKHKPSQMSGGQQQRVGIARAFVADPEVVFADEPTGNLDSKTSEEIMDIIKQMAKDKNQTIVMVTHDPTMTRYANKVIEIHDGKLISIKEGEIH
ncbi:MAG: ABC transporter ATP-binding protein [Clostridia bacterium]|nr:ABC transporter ATP-binding protein [Clostridia bacterium]